MESFNQAQTYDNNSEEQREDGLNLISLLAPRQGSKILDLGCDTGYLTKVLADKVGSNGKVFGIDPDSERLSVAMEKYATTNTTYLEGSDENIPGTAGADYDIVFSNSVLHWCKDKDFVFKNVSKSLKHGGIFGFVDIADYDFVQELFTPAEMFTPECHQYILDHIHPASSDTFKQAATNNGFKITYYKKHLREWKFDDVSKLVEVHMTHFGRGQLNREHFHVEAMKKQYGEGSITFYMPYITILALKK